MKENHLVNYMKHWNSLDKIKEELGIYSFPHPSLPLVLFKYDQIESNKFNQVVRHARSTVLEKDTWNLVSLGFTRFFNYGESWEEQEVFNWNNFFVNEKVDGSFVQLFHYNNEWHVSLSGSWGFQEIATGMGKSWRDFIWKCLLTSLFVKKEGLSYISMESSEKGFNEFAMEHNVLLNKDYTYIFEFVSPYTKVVRTYKEPDLYLLSIMNHAHDPYELNHNEIDTHAQELGFKRPEAHNFKSLKEIEDFLEKISETDPTYEGVVLRDNTGIRFKVKNHMYLTLAHMKDNGNLAAPKNIIPWVLKGDQAELLTYFPEFRDLVDQMSMLIDEQYKILRETYLESQGIEVQKDFALKIKDKTRFPAILFELRKEYGIVYSEEVLKMKWCASDEMINKVLFK